MAYPTLKKEKNQKEKNADSLKCISLFPLHWVQDVWGHQLHFQQVYQLLGVLTLEALATSNRFLMATNKAWCILPMGKLCVEGMPTGLHNSHINLEEND